MEVAHRKTVCTIVQDPMALAMLIICTPLYMLISIYVVLGTLGLFGPIKGSIAIIWFVRILFSACGLTIPLLVLIDPTRYVVWITFTPEHIEYHTIMRRKKFVPYAAVPYIMHGSYFHMVFFRDYIIFSSRKFSTWELAEINGIKPTEYMIKIKYSKRRISKLLPALPEQQRAKVAAIASIIEKKKPDNWISEEDKRTGGQSANKKSRSAKKIK